MATQITKILDDSVAAATTVTEMLPIVPSGKIATVTNFGGYAKDGIVALQWGVSGGAWTTVRASGGSFDLKMKMDFTGDGSKRFRVVRINNLLVLSTVVVWLEGFIHA